MTTTKTMIQALRTEAAEAGDSEQVAICDRALGGEADAWETCALVIDEARAMLDGKNDRGSEHASVRRAAKIISE